MRSLSRLLSPQRIVRLSGRDRNAVLSELAHIHTSLDDSVPLEETLRALVEREQLNSTGIGQGLALPHARIQKARNFSVVLGVHPEGVKFDSFDGELVHLFLMIIGPTAENDMYVQILARASRFLRSKAQEIIKTENPEDIYAMTLEF